VRRVYTEQNKGHETEKKGSVERNLDGLRRLQAVHAATGGVIGFGDDYLIDTAASETLSVASSTHWSKGCCGSTCCVSKAFQGWWGLLAGLIEFGANSIRTEGPPLNNLEA
jgi:hypothetical protein